MSERFIYFIQESRSGNVKIGLAAHTPGGRLDQLQTGNSDELSLIGFIRGADSDLEGELHHRFRNHRIRGEWFKFSKGLKNLVEKSTTLPWCSSCEKRPVVRGDRIKCSKCQHPEVISDPHPGGMRQAITEPHGYRVARKRFA